MDSRTSTVDRRDRDDVRGLRNFLFPPAFGRSKLPKSCSRQIALSVFLLLDGIYFGLILRMLTIGAEGANFAGITLLVGIPSVLIVTVVLLVKATRVALPHSEGMS